MKKYAALLLALALMTSGCALALEYPTHEIEDLFEMPDLSIETGSLEYETHEIEGSGAEPEDEIHSELGGYETHEIEDVDVKPVDYITTELGTYEVPDIEDIDPELTDFYSELTGYLTDDQLSRLSELTPMEAAELTGLQHDLIDDLLNAFAMEGIDIELNRVTGSARIDASLLYATDEYRVTDAGKAALTRILKVYCSVLAQDKYRDSIEQITVIGHTDSVGSYEYNLELSRKRAEAVKDFCLSPESGIGNTEWLAGLLTAEGHSYDERIFNSDGSENKDASRRVEIGFRIRIG